MSLFNINPWHIVVGLVLVIAALLVWNSSLRRSVEESQVRVVELEKEVQVWKEKETNKIDTITTVEEKPDGSKTTVVVRKEESSKVSEGSADKTKVSDVASSSKKVTNDRTRYSVGLYSDINRSLSASVGFALGDLPVEAVILGTDQFKTISAGVQFRW